MPNPYFRFKQFTIYQDRCAMKVGTDGVLLGAWVNTRGVRRILDIGTGTGLIALMLAQRSTAQIHAVEIDPEAAEQAKENFRKSPWNDRLTIFAMDFMDFTPNAERYDLIASNPPYFQNSLRAPDKNRSIARHDHTLSLNALAEGIVPLLTSNGHVGLVYPASGLEQLEETFSLKGLYLARSTDVIPSPGKLPKRVLLEFTLQPGEIKHSTLILEEFGRHQYSEAYKALTREFYL